MCAFSGTIAKSVAQASTRSKASGLMAERRMLAKHVLVLGDGVSLVLEVFGDGASKPRIAEMVGRIGELRQVTARQLVGPLGASRDPSEPGLEGEDDRR